MAAHLHASVPELAPRRTPLCGGSCRRRLGGRAHGRPLPLLPPPPPLPRTATLLQASSDRGGGGGGEVDDAVGRARADASTSGRSSSDAHQLPPVLRPSAWQRSLRRQRRDDDEDGRRDDDDDDDEEEEEEEEEEEDGFERLGMVGGDFAFGDADGDEELLERFDGSGLYEKGSSSRRGRGGARTPSASPHPTRRRQSGAGADADAGADAGWGPRDVTAALNGCRAVADVEAVLGACKGRGVGLNYRHYAAAVQALARVAGKRSRAPAAEKRKALRLLQRLKPGLQRNYTRLRPRTLSVLLAALASLGDRDEALVGDLLYVSLPLMPEFSASELSACLHSLPALGAQPSREWSAAFYEASGARWGEFDARALSSVAWALGALRKRPPQEWLAGFCGAADGRWGAFTAQGLSNVAWGLAAARARPPAGWMQRLLRAARGALGDATPQGAANLAWALAKLSFRPDARFASDLLARTEAMLPRYQPKELSAQIYAFASLGLRPGRAWMEAFFKASGARLDGGFGTQALSNTVWALARLRQPPPRGWMLAFYAAAAAKLPLFGPQALANTLWALARLGARPRGPWLDSALERARALLPLMGSEELASALTALAHLGHPPPRGWLDRLFEESRPRLASMTPGQLAACLFALARLGAAPPDEWRSAALAAVEPRAKLLAPARLADVVWALAELGARPGEELLARFEEEVSDKLLALSPPPRLARAIVAVARHGRAPAAASLLLALEELPPAALSPAALGDLLWALGRVRVRPGSAWVSSAAARVLETAPAGAPVGAPLGARGRDDARGIGVDDADEDDEDDDEDGGGHGADGVGRGGFGGGGGNRRVAAMGPRAWTLSLSGLASLGARPGAEWALAAARATRSLLTQLSGQQLLGCSRALAALAPGSADEVAALLGLRDAVASPSRGAPPAQARAQAQAQAPSPPPPRAAPAASNVDLPALKRPTLPRQAAR